MTVIQSLHVNKKSLTTGNLQGKEKKIKKQNCPLVTYFNIAIFNFIWPELNLTYTHPQ